MLAMCGIVIQTEKWLKIKTIEQTLYDSTQTITKNSKNSDLTVCYRKN